MRVHSLISTPPYRPAVQAAETLAQSDFWTSPGGMRLGWTAAGAVAGAVPELGVATNSLASLMLAFRRAEATNPQLGLAAGIVGVAGSFALNQAIPKFCFGQAKELRQQAGRNWPNGGRWEEDVRRYQRMGVASLAANGILGGVLWAAAAPILPNV